ncbi:RlpA-like double-psi beta-barrel-protein domain-containing protein-containing protein, partial [Hyaloraphidium curvatum]
NGGLGACGTPVYDSQAICAISGADFDPYTPGGNPNRNSLCGSCITISYQGRSASCTLQDRCDGCASGDIDMTPSVFSQLADFGVGRMPVTWSWV